MNKHCNTCKWQRITDSKWGGVQGNTIEHSHTYCSVPHKSQCPVTNGSVSEPKCVACMGRGWFFLGRMKPAKIVHCIECFRFKTEADARFAALASDLLTQDERNAISVLDFKDQDAVAQEQIVAGKYCPTCGKHTLRYIETCESDLDTIKTSWTCDGDLPPEHGGDIVYIYQFKE